MKSRIRLAVCKRSSLQRVYKPRRRKWQKIKANKPLKNNLYKRLGFRKVSGVKFITGGEYSATQCTVRKHSPVFIGICRVAKTDKTTVQIEILLDSQFGFWPNNFSLIFSFLL